MFEKWRRKRENKRKQERCFHEWRVADFSSSVGSHLGIDEVYTIRCVKCDKSRLVDEFGYCDMKKRRMFE